MTSRTFRAFTTTTEGDAVTGTVVTMSTDELPADGVLVFLTSGVSDWVTGHTLDIDGGRITRT